MLNLIFILLIGNAPFLTPVTHADSVIQAESDSVNANRVMIDKIFIIGNKKTRDQIILREMDVKPGEIYEETDLNEILQQEENKIRNLRLFTKVEVSMLHLSPNLVDIIIKVSERWYTFPVPIFSIVDRNLNDWWSNQDGDLSRTNYGIRLYQNNFRGRNETLYLTFQLGFTRRFGINYRIPYIDKAQRHGISFGFDYAENKTMAYRTENHKQLFLDTEEVLRIRRSFNVGYRFRNSFYTRHSAWLVFHSNAVSDTIVSLNPDFYGNGQSVQRYFEAAYAFQYDKRDNISYPLRGNEFEFIATKNGVGLFNDIDQFELKLMYTQYSDLNHGFFLANYSSVYVSAPGQPPYNNLGALGYQNDFVRGYELFLVEGLNYYLNRTTFKKLLFKFRERLNFIPVEQFREFPLAVYLKTYFDVAYVNNIERYEENLQNVTLANRYLYGTGFGLDFVSSYDTVLRFEYSFTREGTSGFFFHLQKEF